MIDWKKMKDDIGKGMKGGAESVARKAEEMTDEGQRKLKIHSLKKHIQEKMEELGATIYNAEKETPGAINHDASMDIFSKIDALSKDLKDLENKETK